MSTALRNLDHATIMEFTVATGQTVAEGMPVGLSAGYLDEVADDTIIGVALKDGDGDVAKESRVPVALLGPVVGVVVGTGGATAGKKATPVATGFQDAPAHNANGNTDDVIAGVFLQAGVAGDIVGMMIASGNRGST